MIIAFIEIIFCSTLCVVSLLIALERVSYDAYNTVRCHNTGRIEKYNFNEGLLQSYSTHPSISFFNL